MNGSGDPFEEDEDPTRVWSELKNKRGLLFVPASVLNVKKIRSCVLGCWPWSGVCVSKRGWSEVEVVVMWYVGWPLGGCEGMLEYEGKSREGLKLIFIAKNYIVEGHGFITGFQRDHLEAFVVASRQWGWNPNSYQVLQAFKFPKGNALTRSIEFIKHSIITQSFDPLMVNHTTATDQFTATSSTMVDINQANMPLALGQQTSGISETNQSEINAPKIVADDKVARKTQRDREYRARCKKGRMQMKDNLVALGGENELLKTENESLKRENALVNQTLESQAEEMEQLGNDMNHMKFEHDKQNILVQILSSELLANPDLRLENQMLKDENDKLRKKVEIDDDSSLLTEDNRNLKFENMVLRVQIDALCGKIANDNC
ncbi:hypothetical protein CRYUN_Cryun26dG0123300 [Craigia yunnanensis]